MSSMEIGEIRVENSIASVTEDVDMKIAKSVNFDESRNSYHHVPAYSTIFGPHPSLFKIYRGTIQPVAPHLDPFTSKTRGIMDG